MTRGSARAALAVAVMALVTGACGGSSRVAVPLPRAPEPAASPAAFCELPGTVLALDGAPEGIAGIRSGAVAVSVRKPDAVVLFDCQHLQTGERCP